MMFITTSRKPGQLTRAIARTLADALGGHYLNRGKAGVQSVLGEADEAGADKVLFVWERYGNPSRLVGFDMVKAREMHAKDEKESEAAGHEKEEGKEKESAGKEEKEIEEDEVDGDQDVENPKVDEGNEDNEPGGKDEETGEQDKAKHLEKGRKDETPEETAWMKPEVGIHGVVFQRRSIRRKGATIKVQDPFGERVAGLLQPAEGPNQIVLSRFGLKIFVDSDSVLELKFKTH